jgi:GH43 family beta-xylosidase
MAIIPFRGCVVMFRFGGHKCVALVNALVVVLWVCWVAYGQVKSPVLTNPAITDAADPFITRAGNEYLLLATHENSITIWSGTSLAALPQNPKVVWKPSDAMKQVWSPTLWQMQGSWWIYFTAEYPGGKHGIYVLQSKTDDPLGEYTLRGRLELGKAAIDPSILRVGDVIYLMYVDVDPKGWNAVWMTPLKDPMTPVDDGRELIFPDMPWERGAGTTHNYPVAEGPTALYQAGKTFIIYSGSDTGTHVYCLGLLMYRGTGDPMLAENWEKSGPVFSYSEEHGVYGPGRGTFTTSPDGKQDWLVYHAKSVKEYTYAGRSVRMQPFTWGKDGKPTFGVPVAEGPLKLKAAK